ncbi:MAG: hypothetical protein ACRC6V_09270 [Bacteroidales bacterium]
MSVKYDVVYSDNRRIPMSGPCFGAFANQREFPHHSLRGDDMNRRREDRASIRELWNNPSNARMIQHYCQPSPSQWCDTGETREVWQARYYSEMKALLQDIPWLKASIHPLLGVIRIPLNNVPADKVMMTLFLFRNLAHYDYARGYRRLRSQGMKPFAAAILSSLWKATATNAFNPVPYWVYNSLGEYNWLNPSTFGRNSLRQLVQAPDDFNPWVQDPWTVQNGYHRDRWFTSNRVLFNPIRDENGEQVPYLRNVSEYRKLTDCLSVQDDSPIWGIINLTWVGGDYTNHDWTTHEGSNMNISRADWDTVLFEFCEQCRDAGYEPYES